MGAADSTAHKDGSIKNAWGYQFTWTADHHTAAQYDHLKYTCDTLAEDCVLLLNRTYNLDDGSERPSTQLQPTESEVKTISPKTKEEDFRPRPKMDLYQLLCDHHGEDEKLQQLWDQVHAIPEWVDWDQIARGQDVFYRYGAAVITGLTYQSLLGGTASSRVTEVLSRSGGFSIKNIRRRLLETTQFNLECTNDIASIKPGGNGFASCLRVRFLHATVRDRILQIQLPIHHTTLWKIFSATIIWQALPRQGIFLRQQEILDYLALWRLVGYYMGVPTDFFSTPAKAKAIMESLYLCEYTPSPTSGLHARNIIQAITDMPPAYASRSYLEANARWLNGDRLADALGLGRPGLFYKCLIAGQCAMYVAISYTCRAIPALDRLQIHSFRQAFWSVITSPEHGLGGLSLFEFQYVPKYRFQPNDDAEMPKKTKMTSVVWTADRKALVASILLVLVAVQATWVFSKVAAWGSHTIYLFFC